MKKSCVRAAIAALVAALVAGCPMPFQYSKEGWSGNASESDPSSPELTASPVLVYSSSAGSGGTIGDGETATTSSDTTITLQSATAGSVIYYTVDGTTPDPRASQTRRYVPGTPITLGIASPTADDSMASLTIKAAAIGPNMKPSAVTSATVTVRYPQAEPPSFSLSDAVYTVDQNLVLTTTTPDATIYYTVAPGSGPAPRPVPGQAATLPYTGPILVAGPSNTWTYAAIAVKGQMIDSRTATASYTVTYEGLPDPTFNPPSGTYSDNVTVRIDSAAGATIWYTRDGTAPVIGTSPSILSGGLVVLDNGGVANGVTTIRAIAAQPQMNPSRLTAAGYVFRAATPAPSTSSGTFNNDITALCLTTLTTGATVHYTTNGSVPDTSSPAYGSPLVVGATTIVKSVAVRPNYQDSDVRTDTYVMQAAPPTFSKAGGSYPCSMTVALSDVTTGAVIHYTRDGSPADASSETYSGTALSIPGGATTQVRAVAVRSGYSSSQEVSATYVIPAAPTGLTAKGAWVTCVFVSWNTVPGAVSYTVLRDTSPSFPAPVYLYPSTNSVTDTGLSGQTPYYYRVRAVYAAGNGDFSSVATGTVLLPVQVPSVQQVSTTGLATPIVLPAGAPAGDYWIGTKQPGWIGNGYTYVVWDPDYENWGSFAIAAYDSSGTFAGQWLLAGNRYITSITLDGTGNFLIAGQNGTTTVPWHTIMLP